MAAPGSRGSAASRLTANACHRLFGLRSLWFVSPDAVTRQPPLCSALPACAPGALRIVRNRQPHIPTDLGIPAPLSPHTQSRRLLTWSGSLSSRTPPASLQISSLNGPQSLFSKVGLHPSVGPGQWSGICFSLLLPREMFPGLEAQARLFVALHCIATCPRACPGWCPWGGTVSRDDACPWSYVCSSPMAASQF